MRELPSLALTLIQPWGTLIVGFGKDVENRSWDPGSRLRPGDRLWIHAGKKLDAEVEAWAGLNVPGYDDAWGDRPAPTGALIGHVRFEGTTYVRTSRWHTSGSCGWRLADPIALPEPIPCKGALGLWRVPEEVLERVRAQEGRGA